MRRVVLGGALVLGACSSPAPTPVASAPAPSAAPASSTAPTPVATCRKRSADQARLLDELIDSLRQPEAGAYRKDHTELFRFLPTLHESGVVSSIAAIHAKDQAPPIFAVTLLVRNAQGGMDANLGFAAMPCADGDLALIAPLLPLGTAAGAIHWSRRLPIASASLTELEMEVSDAPVAGIGQTQPTPHTRSVVVGPKASAKVAVLGTVDRLDDELPPQDGIRRSEARLFGSGWYAHRGGASYLWVHRVEYNRDDLCKLKKQQRPASPPLLRLLAHVDAKSVFTKDPEPGFVVALGDNQPPDGVVADKELTFRFGPTASADRYAEQGPPAQILYGIFETSDAAKARMAALRYTKASFFSTEPPAGAAPAKEPWIIPVRASSRTLQTACMDRY